MQIDFAGASARGPSAAGEAALKHPSPAGYAHQQSRQEHEALGVLHERQLAQIGVHQPVVAGEHQVVDQHEHQEIAAYPSIVLTRCIRLVSPPIRPPAWAGMAQPNVP